MVTWATGRLGLGGRFAALAAGEAVAAAGAAVGLEILGETDDAADPAED